MNTRRFLRSSVLLAAIASIAAQEARSQDKQFVSYSLPPGSARFLQEQVIDVGDVPGHKVRIFENRVDYQNVDLTIAGVRVKESFTRGASDYVNGTGTASNYGVYVLEDGNRLFTKESAVGQVSPNGDGTVVYKYSVVATFTGGTGRFRGIRGQLRGNVVRMPGDAGIRADVTGEYWLQD